MLMILEDKDPTLRLSARSWLQDSKTNYKRIIDPILKEFMSNNKMFRSDSGQLFYEDEEYNSDYVKENFTKLRNIILTTQEDFMQYIILNDYSDYIKDRVESVIRTVDGPLEENIYGAGEQPQNQRNQANADDQANNYNVHSKDKYIEVIVYLTLQFIMGQYVECMNEHFYQET